MVANIDSYIGRLPAWHNLGTVTGEYLTVEKIFADGGLDFLVEKRQLEYSGNPVDAWGIFRTDNEAFLGSVGSEYEPIQHREGFSFLDHIVGVENGAHFETAGSLGRGETVWGLIDLGLVSGIKGTQDQSNNYLLFRTGHIGNFTFSFSGCRTRVVCQNTLNIALNERRSTFTIKHTKNYQDRIDQARVLVLSFREKMMMIDEQMEYLAGRVVDKDNMINILDELFPPDADGNRSTRSKNNIKQILDLYESNDGNAVPQIRGTAYNLLNACTEYTDHFRSVKGNSVRDRAQTAMFGSGDDFKIRALSIITENAKNMPPLTLPVFVPGPQLTA